MPADAFVDVVDFRLVPSDAARTANAQNAAAR
jgi:hypothetical protein